MEFILFLSKLDKEILNLLMKANYIVEENKIIICTENAKGKQILEIRINNQIKRTSKQKGR